MEAENINNPQSPALQQGVVSGCANFDRRNTKVGSIKWTKSFVAGKKKLLRVRIYKIGFIKHLEMQTFHGLILATKEKIVITKYGCDSRFWGHCYHTKEAAEYYG